MIVCGNEYGNAQVTYPYITVSNSRAVRIGVTLRALESR